MVFHRQGAMAIVDPGPPPTSGEMIKKQLVEGCILLHQIF